MHARHVPVAVKALCRLFLLLWSCRILSQHHRDSLGWGPYKSTLINKYSITRVVWYTVSDQKLISWHTEPLTIIQMWVCDSQLIAGSGRVIFGSLWPAKIFLCLISRPSLRRWLGPLSKNYSTIKTKHIVTFMSIWYLYQSLNQCVCVCVLMC